MASSVTSDCWMVQRISDVAGLSYFVRCARVESENEEFLGLDG